ncbi:MAG: hypothetical protein Q9193_002628 [Seirophora villosa]
MIAQKNEFTNFSRRADAKIGLLKRVIERVQNGEDVDVKGLLGTGDPARENEWEDVIEDAEEEDRLWQAKARRREQSKSLKDTEGAKETGGPGSPPLSDEGAAKTSNTDDGREILSPVGMPPRSFY